jgi:hypothetical protein
MVITTLAAGAYVPPYCIIQSINNTANTFVVSPAVWLPAGTSISAQASGTLTSVTVTQGGSGYTGVPTITFSGGGAVTQATGTAIISGGQIVGVTVTSPGYGYTSIPTITVYPILGTVTLTPVLSSIQQTNATVSAGVNTTTMTLSYTTAPGTSGTVTSTASNNTITLSTVANMTVGNDIYFAGPSASFGGVLSSAVTAGNFVIGNSYIIVTLGTTGNTTDFTAIGATANTVGLRFTATGLGAGSGTAQPVYYVASINTLSITIALTKGGSAITSITTVASVGNTKFYSSSFTLGTSQTITGAGAPSLIPSGVYAGQYAVTYSFTGTYTPPTGVYYSVGGNSNGLYNGYFIASTSIANTSVTLVYPYNPGTYGSGTTTFTVEATNGASTTLGISKPFSAANSFNPRAGYPALEAAQITTRISTCRATGHDFLNIGTGSYTTSNWPTVIYGNPAISPIQSQEILEEGVGRVFYVTTDQNGIFRVGRFFTVDQGTGTVTFSASIALSNLDGLGFKRGVTIAEFSTDSSLTNNASDTVPVQSAVRSFVDRRLGLDYGGSPIASSNLIGPGYLALNGSLAMKAALNMALYTINNLANPSVGGDATNKTYVDTQVASINSIYKLKDVATAMSGTQAAGNFLVYDATATNNSTTTGGWKNIGLPTGDVNITFNATGSGTLTTTIQAGKIVDSMVSSSAAIVQSKLNMTFASTRSTSAGTQASLGLASFDSVMFTADNGFISHANSTSTTTGLVYTKLRYASSGSILGNRTGSAATISEMTPVNVVTDGNGISNAGFTAVGAMVVTATGNSTFNGVTNTGGGNTYAVVAISVANAASSLVKSDTDKSVDVGSLKVNGYSTLSVSGTTLTLTTPGGYGSVTFSGTNVTNAVTTTNGTLDTTSGTLKATTITTGAAGTSGSITGQYAVQTSSQIDFSLGTLKSTTLTTGADATAGTIQGSWTLTGASKLQATYADLAEWYTTDQDYEPGTVLVFGGNAETTTTNIFGDTRLAGIVTTDPAYIMNSELQGQRVCLALAGRVPCKVLGRVKKGDILTTSAIAGCAVKAIDPKIGSIVGKAIEDKDYDSVGVIEVAVGRA